MKRSYKRREDVKHQTVKVGYSGPAAPSEHNSGHPGRPHGPLDSDNDISTNSPRTRSIQGLVRHTWPPTKFQ